MQTLSELGFVEQQQSYSGAQNLSVANPEVLHQYTAAKRKYGPRLFTPKQNRSLGARIMAGADYINRYGDTFAQGGLDAMTLGAFSKIEQHFDYVDATDHSSWVYRVGNVAGVGLLGLGLSETGLLAQFSNVSKATKVILGGLSSAFATKLDDPDSSIGTLTFSFITGSMLGHYSYKLPSFLENKIGVAILSNILGQTGATLTSKTAKYSLASFIGAAVAGSTELAIESSGSYLMDLAATNSGRQINKMAQSSVVIAKFENIIVDTSVALRTALASYLPARVAADYFEDCNADSFRFSRNMRR